MSNWKKILLNTSSGGGGWAAYGIPGNGRDLAGLAVDSNNNFYISYTNIVKISFDGEVQWWKDTSYGSYTPDVTYFLHIDSSDNIFATGYLRSATNEGALTQQWDSSGTYQGTFFRSPASTSESTYGQGISDGTYFYVPEVREANYSGYQIIKKSDMTGYWPPSPGFTNNRNVSQHTLSGGFLAWARRSICLLDSSGNTLFISPYDHTDGYTGTKISKFSSSGTLISNTLLKRTADSTEETELNTANAVAIDSSDNLYLAVGYKYVVKVNSSGSIVWQKEVVGATTMRSLNIDEDGDIHFTFRVTSGANIGAYHYCVDSSGDIVFRKLLTRDGTYAGSAGETWDIVSLAGTGNIGLLYGYGLINIPKGDNATWTDGTYDYEIADTTNISLSTTTNLGAGSLTLSYSGYSGSNILSPSETVTDNAGTITTISF